MNILVDTLGKVYQEYQYKNEVEFGIMIVKNLS